MSARSYFGTPEFDAALSRFDPCVSRVVSLSARLCAEPGVTVPAHRADLAAVRRTMSIAAARASELGLGVRVLESDEGHPYPLLIAWPRGSDPRAEDVHEVIALIGHLDVVGADASQWRPLLEGDVLHARGATDMKTVVATFLEWMGSLGERPAGAPALVLALSGCEENGSISPWSAADALDWLERDCGARVRFAIVGERTGELEWMKPAPVVGPICRENRSWRWLRCATSDRGEGALARVAAIVGSGREGVAALNRSAVPPEKAARQPGLRSGWLCSFAWIPGEIAGEIVRIERPAGASAHAAAADVSAPSSLEILARAYEIARDVAREAGASVALAALRIGEDGNFNSFDGSGVMWLSWSGPGPDLAGLAERTGLGASVVSRAEIPSGAPEAIFGLDIRELLDHKAEVEGLLARIESEPRMQVTAVNARPAWRCPEDSTDLGVLLSAWASVVGEPSPDLVKLHGNDGGLIAAREGATGLAPVVVFGQVGARPHGPDETHDCRSVRPYWDILDRFMASVWGGSAR